MKVLKFSASWCQPCAALTKTLKEMENLPEIENVDIDGNLALATKFAIRSVPTLVMVDESDQEIKRMSGSSTKEKLKEFFQN